MKKITIISLSLFFLACTKEVESSKMVMNEASNSSTQIAMSSNSNGIAFSGENVKIVDDSNTKTSSEVTENSFLSLSKGSSSNTKSGVNIPNPNGVNMPSGATKINMGGSSSTIGGTGGVLNGNSPEALACSKDAEGIWKQTKEYHDAMDDPCSLKPLYYSYFAQAKLIEVILDNCGEFLSDKDKASFKILRDDALKIANDLKDNAVSWDVN
jgi:hypothetical protein